MKKLVPFASGLVFLGAVALLSFLAVRILARGSGDDQNASGHVVESPAPFELGAILAQDAEKPRFVGEILGIYISPNEESVPSKHRVPACASQVHVEVPWGEAGQLALDVQLPPQFVFQPDDINTGVIACEGTGAYAARWAYELPQPQFVDYPARLIIARGLGTWVYADASTDRVKIIEAGGRQAVLIEPVRPEGSGLLGQNGTQASVIFPETFGATSISSSGASLADLLQVAEIVGSATTN